jgi:hypothetical protein
MAEEDRTWIVSTRAAKIRLRRDGIIHVVGLPGIELSQADARAIIAALVRISQGKKHPVLVDIRQAKTVDREARQDLTASTAPTAVALVVASPVSQVIGNSFMGLNRAVIPLRLFTSEAEAVEWLKGFHT